jgi:putative tRNA adenosine deaminase-associated protein
VAYFAALLVRTEDGWEASEAELDDVESLGDLAGLARESAVDEETVLVLLEQEDAWFCIVRVDGEDDPRVYVSDGTAAARSSYGELILAGLLPDLDSEELPDLDHVELQEGEEEEDPEDGGSPPAVPAGPLGDSELLADLGVAAKELNALGGEGALPAEALSEITESLGCAEILEAVR